MAAKKDGKKKPAKKRRKAPVRALVIKQLALSQKQYGLIQQETPAEFIKERKARGSNLVRYVEGGYVVAQLNKIFGAVNWDFEILHEEVLEKEVWVRGRLIVKDHQKGFEVGKTQYGQHARHANVPLGDALKSAATDCLKKCAAQGFGIALDVYWQQLDEDAPKEKKGTKKASSDKVTIGDKIDMIKALDNTIILNQMRSRVRDGALPEKQKKLFIDAIDARIKELEK